MVQYYFAVYRFMFKLAEEGTEKTLGKTEDLPHRQESPNRSYRRPHITQSSYSGKLSSVYEAKDLPDSEFNTSAINLNMSFQLILI